MWVVVPYGFLVDVRRAHLVGKAIEADQLIHDLCVQDSMLCVHRSGPPASL